MHAWLCVATDVTGMMPAVQPRLCSFFWVYLLMWAACCQPHDPCRHDDMTALVTELAPARWKVFQVCKCTQSSGRLFLIGSKWQDGPITLIRHPSLAGWKALHGVEICRSCCPPYRLIAHNPQLFLAELAPFCGLECRCFARLDSRAQLAASLQ